MFSSEPVSGTKSDRTRERIRAAALRSFRERGYEATTIRLIAGEAGVSVGTTNYHFASKNHLVQELYLQVQRGHAAAAQPLLDAAGGDIVERLRIVYAAGLDQLDGYHAHAAEFLAAAVSPRSPINPLAAESAEALSIVERLFSAAVGGATNVPADLRSALPRALVLAHLLLAMFWVYDRSPGQQRTRRLLDQGLGILRSALPVMRVPVLRAPLRRILALVDEVRA